MTLKDFVRIPTNPIEIYIFKVESMDVAGEETTSSSRVSGSTVSGGVGGGEWRFTRDR